MTCNRRLAALLAGKVIDRVVLLPVDSRRRLGYSSVAIERIDFSDGSSLVLSAVEDENEPYVRPLYRPKER